MNLPGVAQARRLSIYASRLVSVHESGHVIVLKALGYKPKQIKIVPGLIGEAQYHLSFLECCNITCLEQDAILLGGFVASRLCRGYPREMCRIVSLVDFNEIAANFSELKAAYLLARKLIRAYWKEFLSLSVAISRSKSGLSGRAIERIVKGVNKTSTKQLGLLPEKGPPYVYRDVIQNALRAT